MFAIVCVGVLYIFSCLGSCRCRSCAMVTMQRQSPKWHTVCVQKANECFCLWTFSFDVDAIATMRREFVLFGFPLIAIHSIAKHWGSQAIYLHYGFLCPIFSSTFFRSRKNVQELTFRYLFFCCSLVCKTGIRFDAFKHEKSKICFLFSITSSAFIFELEKNHANGESSSKIQIFRLYIYCYKRW